MAVAGPLIFRLAKRFADSNTNPLEFFRQLDSNHNGSLDEDELGFLLTHMDRNLTSAQIRQVFNAFDKDRNGNIEQGEFLARLEKAHPQKFPIMFDTGSVIYRLAKWFADSNTNPSEIFTQLDRNQNGSLNEDEFGFLLIQMDRNLTSLQVRQVFNAFDKDRNGNIEQGEFLSRLEGAHPQKFPIRCGAIVETGSLIYRLAKWFADSNTNPSEFFRQLDSNHNGSLDEDELGFLLTQMDRNLTSAQIRQVFNAFDKDRNGNIEQGEFLSRLEKAHPQKFPTMVETGSVIYRLAKWFADSNTNPSEFFTQLDRNQNGSLDENEFGFLLTQMDRNLTSGQIRQVFNAFDKDRNGNIEQGEFLVRLEKAHPQKFPIRRPQPLRFRCDFPPGMDVEYYRSLGVWIPAKVVAFHADKNVYDLDIRANVPRESLRVVADARVVSPVRARRVGN